MEEKYFNKNNEEFQEMLNTSKENLWFSDRLALENEYKKWVKELEIADCLNNFIVFLVLNDLIDTKKTIEYLRLVGDKNEGSKQNKEIL